jgi:hypothetical protein
MKKAQRDLLFDALAAIGGGAVGQMTRAMRGCINGSLKQIIEASPDVTPEEIARRAALYRRRHPTWPCTATALCKYWSELGPANPTTAAKEDLYQEPVGDWHATVLRIFSLDVFPEGWDNWQSVPHCYREQIKKETQ